MICLFGRGFESHQLHKRSKRSQKTTSLFLLVLIETAVREEDGSVENQWGYAYSFAILKRKNFLSATPLRFALKSLIFALQDSAIAFEARLL